MTTAALSGAADLGGRIGGVAGGVMGGAIGSIFGPVGTAIGRFLGSRAGQLAGRAAAAAIANAMEGAEESVEELSDQDAAAACAECQEIDCFKVPEGVDPDEFAKQLKDQQDALNQMSPDEVLRNMDAYAAAGRPAGEAVARAAERAAYRARRIREVADELVAGGMGRRAAEIQAGLDVGREMRNLDALHNPDLSAGGAGTIGGLGNRSINRSIGSQWGQGRADQLRRAAEAQKRAGKATMEEVELKICPEEGGAGAPASSQPPSSGPGGAGPGAGGGVPMS